MSSDCEPWKGLKILWSLKPVPRAKHFIWLVFKGKIKTANFLYALNLRPQDLCIFCGLNFESAEHILNLCLKVQAIWNMISNLVGKTISFPNGFISGVWSETDHCVYPNFVKSVVVGSAWYIWKTRCNVIFRHEELDFNSIRGELMPYRKSTILPPIIKKGRISSCLIFLMMIARFYF